MIETGRLEIRPLKHSDNKPLSLLFADSEVMEFSDNGTKTMMEVIDWVGSVVERSRTSNGVDLFAVDYKKTSALIGYCGLTLYPDIEANPEIEIGYRLIKKYWGHGFATEAASAVRDYAFCELKLPRLVALIEPTNMRSIRVANKIGMSFEKEVMLENYDHPDHLYSIENTVIST